MRKINYATCFLLALTAGQVWGRCPDTAPQPPTKEEDFYFCVTEETLSGRGQLIARLGQDNLPQRLGHTFVFHKSNKFKFGLGFGHQVGLDLAMHTEKIGTFEGHAVYKLSDELGFIIRVGGGSAATGHPNGKVNQAGDGQFQQRKFPNGTPWIRSADSLGTRIELEPLLLKVVPAGQPIPSPARVKIATVRFRKAPHSNVIGYVVPTGTYWYDVWLDLTSYSIRSELKTCSLNNAHRNISLKFPTVGSGSFRQVGDLLYGATAQLQLDCSQAGGVVTPYAVLHDVNNPNNRSDTLSIETGSGKATGVGIKLFKDNDATALKYGAADINRTSTNNWALPANAWKFADRGTQFPTVRLTGYYVRTGNITPGDVNAQATITFSYQ
ncbi:fimbrial protein [[Haemophilus] felis]|nr:fimbrial protein [[Haemophilus] felis]